MMLVRAGILLILGIGCLECCEETRCQKLANMAEAFLEGLSTTGRYDHFINMTERHLKFDVTDPEARKEVLCRIADATTVQELYVVVQDIVQDNMTLEKFAALYKGSQDHLIRNLGGYTNLHRLFQIYSDFRNWKKQLKCGDSLQERTDLPALTHFLEVMQVKYGSRWMSYIANSPYQSVLVKNTTAFAEILYVNGAEASEGIASLLGIDKSRAVALVKSFNEKPNDDKDSEYNEEQHRRNEELHANLLAQIGDMGYLNLKQDIMGAL